MIQELENLLKVSIKENTFSIQNKKKNQIYIYYTKEEQPYLLFHYRNLDYQAGPFCDYTYHDIIDLAQSFHLFLSKEKSEIRIEFEKQIEESSIHQNVSMNLDQIEFYERAFFYSFIEDGNEDMLLKYLNETTSEKRVLDDISISQAKLIAALQLGTVSQAAIKGGVPDFRCREIENIFLQKLDAAHSVKDVRLCIGQIYSYFTHEVASIKQNNFLSGELSDCIRYIGMNVYKPITLEDVASRYNYNPTYFSRKFKQVYHTTFHRFLLKARLSEATRLLKYSDTPVDEISYQLCFSSQSHFQKAFKNEFGITPKKYREEMKKQF